MSGRVLVTGASGFVGAAVVAALRRTGRSVRGTSRNPAELALKCGIEAVAVPDLERPFDWGPAVAGVDAVVHLAAIAHIGPRLDADVYDRANHLATADLARACVRAGVRRLVFMSSVRAQSGASAERVLTEADEPRPTEAYGISKLRAEAAVRASAVPSVILRPAVVYGPGVKGNLATLLRVAGRRVPPPLGGFRNRRSLVSLANLVAAVERALSRDILAGETFLVADPEPLTLAEIVAALRCGAGRRGWLPPVPPALFKALLKSSGRGEAWERIGGELVVDPSKLVAAGWRPDSDTRSALTRLAAQPARS